MLGIGLAIELILIDQLFANMSTAALGKQSVLAAQFHAGCVKAIFRLAVTIHPKVPGYNSAHHASFVDQRLLSRKAWVNLNPQVLRLLAEPSAEIGKGNDVVTFVVHRLGHKESRYLGGGIRTLQQIDIVALHWRVERRPPFLPIGEQLVQGASFKHCT
ncbi:hypothetical protein D3C75_822070 [compost metagenome]